MSVASGKNDQPALDSGIDGDPSSVNNVVPRDELDIENNDLNNTNNYGNNDENETGVNSPRTARTHTVTKMGTI